jgi:uncharacterized protein (TIGR03118 family)
MNRCSFRRLSLVTTVVMAMVPRMLVAGTLYQQINLVSDIPGMAANTDPNLKNPWGVSFNGSSPFWVSDQMAGVSTLYNGAGQVQGLVVTTPPGSPTGQVFNTTTGLKEPNGSSALFIFDTLAGTVDAWNQNDGTTAVTVASKGGAVYTGLALDSNASGSFLYAANVSGGIDVYNSSFQPVFLAGSFTDPNLPAGYTPYNIQNIGGTLYVAYVAPSFGPGMGAVSVFDANGDFIKELVAPGGALDAPWGLVLAPNGFGSFANDLLVGNFGNGEINAFNSMTGQFLGTLNNLQGNPIVNYGLWALTTRDAAGFNPDAVYFTAGINGQADGLFGSIAPVPEPGTWGLAACGLLTALAIARRMRLS